MSGRARIPAPWIGVAVRLGLAAGLMVLAVRLADAGHSWLSGAALVAALVTGFTILITSKEGGRVMAPNRSGLNVWLGKGRSVGGYMAGSGADGGDGDGGGE